MVYENVKREPESGSSAVVVEPGLVTTDMPSISKSTKPQKFFERFLDNDLEELKEFLQTQYQRVETGELLKGDKNQNTPWNNSNSETTIQWNRYNTFQFYHPAIHNLFSAVKDMVVEACDYYDIDFKKQQYYAQSWFNINYAKKGKLDWHEHGGTGAPHYHGYYCVQAEPSVTHYKVFDKYVNNINKNNRAVISETGHPHAMADWDWEGPRITIAYDVVPLRDVHKAWEQHWVPLV